MDKDIRGHIQRATQAARSLLEREYAEQLEGTFDIRSDGTIATEPGEHLDDTQRSLRQKLVAAIQHHRPNWGNNAEAVEAYLREAALSAKDWADLRLLNLNMVVGLRFFLVCP